MSYVQPSGERGGCDPSRPPVTQGDGAPDMTISTMPVRNGKDRTQAAHIPNMHDAMISIRSGWAVLSIILAVSASVISPLVIHGWFISPAKSTELAAAIERQSAVNKELSEKLAAFGGTLAEVKKDVSAAREGIGEIRENAIRLEAQIAVLNERRGGQPIPAALITSWTARTERR